MDATEIENYRFQLKQVEDTIAKDPNNEKLKKLKSDLLDLIALGENALIELKPTKPSQPSSSSSQPPKNSSLKSQTVSLPIPGPNIGIVQPIENNAGGLGTSSNFKIGDVVEARWSGDGRFYEARIEAVPKPDTFSVQFTAYGTVEFVKSEDVRAAKSNYVFAKKRTMETQKDETKVKKKKATFEERMQKREAEQRDRQQAWKKFQGKAGLKSKSIFSTTSELPEAKTTGLANPGRLSRFGARSKPIFKPGEE